MAILVGASAAQAASWDLPGFYTFVATSSGAYAFGVIGATGGRATNVALQPRGGVGAEITGEFTLTKGKSVDVIVGGPGENGPYAGGGGGLSAIAPASGNAFVIVAGGGAAPASTPAGFPARAAPMAERAAGLSAGRAASPGLAAAGGPNISPAERFPPAAAAPACSEPGGMARATTPAKGERVSPAGLAQRTAVSEAAAAQVLTAGAEAAAFRAAGAGVLSSRAHTAAVSTSPAVAVAARLRQVW